MVLFESASASSAGPPFGSDLHGFIEQYERTYPHEVLHIEEPLNAEWEISALARKFEKAQRFPLLVFYNVIIDGQRATMPLTTFLMASRLRLASAMDTEGQGKTAAVSPLTSYIGLKHAFVFDEDVDTFDEREVLLALATRFQADRGLVTLPGMTGSPLDPSSADGRLVCKAGFDCTKPIGKPFAERLSISKEVLDRIDPLKIIGERNWSEIPVEPWG
jgi:3-polyprenyl-4-hydroxybenzoate decarboxylase